MRPQSPRVLALIATAALMPMMLSGAAGAATPGAERPAAGVARKVGGETAYSQPGGVVTPNQYSMVKTGGGSVQVGGIATFTLTTTNQGPGVASANAVTVTDPIPSNLAPVSASGTNWTCSISAQSVSCTYIGPQVAPGKPLPPITVTARGTKTGPYTNCATAAPYTKPNGGNNNKTAAAGPTGCASGNVVQGDQPNRNLGILKLGGGAHTAGDQVAFRIEAANYGPGSIASGWATVTDIPPPGLILVSYTAPGWTCTVSGQTLTCTLGVAAGVGPLPLISITTRATTVGSFQNCATIRANMSVDPNPGNNQSCAAYSVQQKTK